MVKRESLGSIRVIAELLRTEDQSLHKTWLLSNKIFHYYGPVIRMSAHVNDSLKGHLKEGEMGMVVLSRKR